MHENLLLTDEQVSAKYEELGDDFPHPYFFRITNGHQVLYFLGCNHSYDEANPQFARIKELWSGFIAETTGQDCILMVEGMPIGPEPELHKPKDETESEAIDSGGEHGYAAYWATRAGVPYYTPEPNRVWEVNELVRRFDRDAVMYYYFIRQASQWHRMHQKESFKEYLQVTLDTYSRIPGWDDFDFSFDNMVRIHDATHDHAFYQDDLDCFKLDSSPRGNPVSSACSNLRDVHIVSEIKKHWDRGKSVFVVYGSGHAIKDELALKKLLQKKA